MAVRAPLYWDGTEVQEMSIAQVTAICERMNNAYSGNETVTLSVVASAGTLAAMDDTRYQAGTFTTSTTAYATEAATPDISTITTTFDKISQSKSSPSSYPVDANKSYPCYWDTATGEIRAMTQQDMIDTFVDQATDLLAAGNTESDTSKKAGSYTISTSNSLAGATLVDVAPIYTDTRADATLYTSGGIPEAQDQPEDVNNYYLHQWNGDASAGADVPLMINITGGVTDLQTYSDADWDFILSEYIRYATENEIGQRINFEIYEVGSAPAGANLCGTAIVDTTLDGSSASGYTTRLVNANDYRTQEFPNGVPTTIKTYGLYVTKS